MVMSSAECNNTCQQQNNAEQSKVTNQCDGNPTLVFTHLSVLPTDTMYKQTLTKCIVNTNPNPKVQLILLHHITTTAKANQERTFTAVEWASDSVSGTHTEGYNIAT